MKAPGIVLTKFVIVYGVKEHDGDKLSKLTSGSQLPLRKMPVLADIGITTLSKVERDEKLAKGFVMILAKICKHGTHVFYPLKQSLKS